MVWKSEMNADRYRVLNPFALPNDTIILKAAGVGEFRQGDIIDNLTARRLRLAACLSNGTIEPVKE